MLEFINQSLWAGGLYPGWDAKLQPQLTAVFKVTYEFNEQGELIPLGEQPAIIETDEHAADPLASSLKAANETAPFKKGSDFYLYGTAYPERDDLLAMDVGVGILFADGKEWKKVLRVFGQRKWNKTMLNYQHDDQPGFVEVIPLSYEYSFGGRNPKDIEDEYLANPIGIGYNSDQRNLCCERLPRIEMGPGFITTPMQKPIPAGFGPLPVWWEPRRSEIGLPVDDPMEQGGCPYSKSAQDTLHNAAPVDQRFSKRFQGGEVIHLRGLVKDVSHNKSVKIVLPELHPQLYTIIDDKAELLTPVCDTVVVNADEKTVAMVYRAGIPWRLTDRRQGWVILKDLDFVELPYVKDGRDAPRMAF